MSPVTQRDAIVADVGDVIAYLEGAHARGETAYTEGRPGAAYGSAGAAIELAIDMLRSALDGAR